jgi:FKBP-type peptidyl-prolyl cis-trans isomerase
MKKIILLGTCLSIMVCSLAQKTPAPAKPRSNATEDTISYSLGVYMMQQLLAKTGFFPSNQVMFKKAIDDVIQNKTLMVNPASTQDRLLAYQKTFQLAKGRKLEELLFAKVKNSPGFATLPGGISYSVSKMGDGTQAKAKDTVIVNVITSLPDGTEIDNTNKTKQSYMAIVGEMVPGLREVLLRMKEGTICRAIVPAAMAYGEQGTATIPPNSAIIYDVALVQVKPAK